jgi:hypothetical protein
MRLDLFRINTGNIRVDDFREVSGFSGWQALAQSPAVPGSGAARRSTARLWRSPSEEPLSEAPFPADGEE